MAAWAAISPSGARAFASHDGTNRWVRFDSEPDILMPAHANALAVSPSGNMALVRGRDDRTYLVFRGGGVADIGSAAGTNCVGFRSDGAVVFIDTAETYVWGAETLPVPRDSSGDLISGQGWTQIFDSGPAWTDFYGTQQVGSGVNTKTLTRVVEIAGWKIGMDTTQDRILGWDGTNFWIVWDGYTPYGPGAELVSGLIVVAISGPGIFIPATDFVLLPVPVPVPPPTKTCFPRKIFFSPYLTHSERYGITPEFIGNVSFPDATVEAPGPFLQDVPTYREDRSNQTLAIYVHNSTIGHNPPLEYTSALGRDKPIILYLDSRLWPVSRPAWIDPSRTFLGIQCYRGRTESVDSFRDAMRALLGRLEGWDLPFVLTVQAYDRNGTVGPDHAVEALDVAAGLVEDFRVIGLQPFSDMRPGGMNDHPAIKAKVQEMFMRVPGRPNRFDYWALDDASLRSKLDYDVPQFTEGERNRLKECLL